MVFVKVLYLGKGPIGGLGFHTKGIETDALEGMFAKRVIRTNLKDALNADPEIDVTYMPPEMAIAESPSPKKYDVLIVSDIVGSGTGSLTTPVFDETKATRERINDITSFVEEGGGFLYFGGEMSFQGRGQAGGWWSSPIKHLLPVEILPVHDDTTYSSEGFKLNVKETTHALTKGIPWNTCPLFSGYNIVGEPKKGANLLATIGYPGEERDPGLVEWTYGKGRVAVFTSDAEPEWGEDFAKWEYYPKFWTRAVKWLAGKL